MKSPKRLPRSLVAFAVAACVLVAQAGLARHDLGHAFEALAEVHDHAGHGHGPGALPSPREHDRHDAVHIGAVPEGDDGGGDACPLHGLFAEVGAFALAGVAAPAIAANAIAPAPGHATPAAAAPRLAFRSRAPPPTSA